MSLASRAAMNPVGTAAKGLGDALAIAEKQIAQFGFNLSAGLGQRIAQPLAGVESAMERFSVFSQKLASAFSGFYDQLAAAGSGMGRFVDAFSPSQTMVFGQAMRDLSAVIGRALAPAFDVLTGVVKTVGAALNPVFEQLGQVLKPVIEALGGLAATVGRAFAGFLQSIMPLLSQMAEFLAPVIRGLGAMAEAVGAVIGAFAQVLSGYVGKVGSIGEQVGGLLKQFASGLLQAVAVLSKFISGSNSFIDAMIKGLKGPEGERDITGTAAAQGSRFTGFGEFGRQMALAASLATAGGGAAIEDEQKKWREDVLRKLVELKDDEKAREWINGAADAIVKAVYKIIEKTADAYESNVSRPLGDFIKKKTGAKKVFYIDDLFFGAPDE